MTRLVSHYQVITTIAEIIGVALFALGGLVAMACWVALRLKAMENRKTPYWPFSFSEVRATFDEDPSLGRICKRGFLVALVGFGVLVLAQR